VERFERAVRGPASGKTSHTAAQAGIDTMASGLEAARMLDVIVANQFRRDPVTHAVWKTRRRIDTGRRGRRPVSVTALPQSHAEPSPSRTGLTDGGLESRTGIAAPVSERSTTEDVGKPHSSNAALKVAS